VSECRLGVGRVGKRFLTRSTNHREQSNRLCPSEIESLLREERLRDARQDENHLLDDDIIRQFPEVEPPALINRFPRSGSNTINIGLYSHFLTVWGEEKSREELRRDGCGPCFFMCSAAQKASIAAVRK
jgi:hypothetical protein